MLVDGRGSGNKAHVDSENRLHVESVSRSRFAHVAEHHESAFIVNSGFVNITTTGNWNGLIFMKNVDAGVEIHIEKIRICGTGASMSFCQIELVRNPTVGSIVTDDSPVTVYGNSTFASTLSPFNSAEILRATAQGKDVTDGYTFDNFVVHTPGHDTIHFDGAIILDKNNSFAIRVKNQVAGEFCCHIFYSLEEAGHEH